MYYGCPRIYFDFHVILCCSLDFSCSLDLELFWKRERKRGKGRAKLKHTLVFYQALAYNIQRLWIVHEQHHWEYTLQIVNNFYRRRFPRNRQPKKREKLWNEHSSGANTLKTQNQLLFALSHMLACAKARFYGVCDATITPKTPARTHTHNNSANGNKRWNTWASPIAQDAKSARRHLLAIACKNCFRCGRSQRIWYCVVSVERWNCGTKKGKRQRMSRTSKYNVGLQVVIPNTKGYLDH